MWVLFLIIKHCVNANMLYLCDLDNFLMSLYMYDGMLSIDSYQSLFQCVSVFQRKHPDGTFLPPRSIAEHLYDIIYVPRGLSLWFTERDPCCRPILSLSRVEGGNSLTAIVSTILYCIPFTIHIKHIKHVTVNIT